MLENIRLSFQGILAHKMRSFLTMLGIIIGIASIIAIVSTIKGTNEQIKNNLIGSGSNTVKINLVMGDSTYDFGYETPPQEVVPLDDKSRENIMKNAVREPYFVHENMKADRLFEQMKQSGSDHFAVVVDEYGGMSGIITVTDLVEQLVGEFSDDEDDVPQPHIEKTGDNMWLIPGTASVAEVSEELDITIPADNFETFGGYVIAELGEIPKDGSQLTLEAGGLKIAVLEVKHHRIEVCRVNKLKTEKRTGKTQNNAFLRNVNFLFVLLTFGLNMI